MATMRTLSSASSLSSTIWTTTLLLLTTTPTAGEDPQRAWYNGAANNGDTDNATTNISGHGSYEVSSSPATASEASSEAVAAITSSHSKADCMAGRRTFDPIFHKQVYKIGLHAPGGIDTAVRQFNMTFQDYLNATVGMRFDPPIGFEIVPTNTPLYSWIDLPNDIDFHYSDTGVYSCVGVEMGAEPIAATIKDFAIRGHHEKLDMFAGTMLVRKDRKDLKSIEDIRDKVVGALEIGDFAGAQAQFYVMGEEGMNYIMDPKQVIFTVNERMVVQGVLDGRWDVGFVRTGMVEMMAQEDDSINPADFTVLNPQLFIMDNGEMFPFMHSTPTFPEWPFYGGKHVPPEVIEEVQEALIAMQDHRETYVKMMECPEEHDVSQQVCEEQMSIKELHPEARCDTTKKIAALAWEAGKAGSIDGFRPPRSYFNLRTMQQAGGFIRKDEEGDWKCTRAETLYGAIQCPTGFHLVPEDEFNRSCDIAGVPCPDGLACMCKPCTLEVEVSLMQTLMDKESNITHEPCMQEEFCGLAVQSKPLVFEMYDNARRDHANIRVTLEIAGSMRDLPIQKVDDAPHHYQFAVKETTTGLATITVFVDDIRSPQSPFLVEVYPRDCKAEYEDGSREATEDGQCKCASGYLQLGDKCMSSAVIFSMIAAILAAAGLAAANFYLRHKRNLSDQVWLVNPEELHFNDPVEIIGSGGFGEVLLAEYRGTKVAIKRVVRPEKKEKAKQKARALQERNSVASVAVDNKSVDSFDVLTDGEDSPSAHDSQSTEQEGVKRDSVLADLEAGKHARSFASTASVDLNLLAQLSRGNRGPWSNMCPGGQDDQHLRMKTNILGSASSRSSMAARYFCFGQMNKRKQQFLMEMRLLSRLRHPCITTVMGAVISPFHDPMLVMEYMEYGSLSDLLQNETMYTGGDVILQIMRDIAQGLRYLHSSKPPICHGDLKARNILVDSRFRAKVADFGLSEKKKNSVTGTPFFMAPEYLRGRQYSPACDIYSVGMIMWEIYAREDPYKGEALMKVLRDVCDPSVNRRPKIPDTMSPKMVEIMKKCWSADPFYRPQAKDLDMLLMDMNITEAEPVSREQRALNKEKKPRGDMLYEVFPRHIADALKAGRKVEPESHEMVTIFFSDVVGFTDISRKMSPLKVSAMLERLYEAFDKLARAHKVFKVETIGDAYMGVTNLDQSQDGEHVKNIAQFAVEAIEVAGTILIDEDNPHKGYIRIRAGFHSGPVVSNVIGSLNPRYGLFGDTVNTASRMESNSKPGKILCSEDSAYLLMEQAPKLIVKQRGRVAVKGKGQMTTFWVRSPRSKNNGGMDNSHPSANSDLLRLREDNSHPSANTDVVRRQSQREQAPPPQPMEAAPQPPVQQVKGGSSSHHNTMMPEPIDLLADSSDNTGDSFLGDLQLPLDNDPSEHPLVPEDQDPSLHVDWVDGV